ncbi:hypothetical protein [Streptomyces vietnamensis]|uniref:hypothetical protein n=1 Tax=Streptomyces vietnamensis TaxID=362257 RepID=UPI003430CC3D
MTETAHAVRTAERDCPEYGKPVAEGGQYVTWCAACDWNVDPEVRDEETPGRIERVRRRLARRYGEQLLADLSDPAAGAEPGAADGARPGTRLGVAGRFATALAVTVHGVTVALLAVGLWLLVGCAFQSLGTWRYTLAPAPAHTLVEHFANLVTALPLLLVDGLLVLLEHLTLRQSQRAEYLADSTAARIAGAEAAAGPMDRLLIGESVVGALHRESVAARTRIGGAARREDPAEGLWERLAAHAESVPEHEYERLCRVAERRGHQVDSTHPPTHLRHRRLTRGVPGGALIVLDAARAAEVDAELAEAKRGAARELVRG